MKARNWIALVLTCSFSLGANASALDDMLNQFKQAGGHDFSSSAGQKLWTQKHPAPNGGEARSCAACHTTNLTQQGKHIRTGKIIQPMAPSVNPKRLTKAKKMKKWLKRNCKWVMGRECTAQEKGDILTFISQYK